MTLMPAESLPLPAAQFEVRFASLLRPGCMRSFPCDGAGHVDLDALSDRARNDYLFARAMVGREHDLPRICRCGSSGPGP